MSCTVCGTTTSYVCIDCEQPVCNKSTSCSRFAPETSKGWKAGFKVASCRKCCGKREQREEISVTEQSKSTPQKPVKNEKNKVKNISSSKARTCLSIDDKVELIKYHESHPQLGVRKIAEKFSCGRTQVSTIIKNKESILDEAILVANQASRKRQNPQKFSEINEYLWAWYNRCRESNVPVSGPMLQEEAKLTAERLGDNEFQGSNGWLEKWKKRYNIKEMRVAGEDGDVNEVTLDSWQERVRELTKGYAPENVWNMDETGQFWKALPEKSLSEAGKRCRGGKKAKQRCTWAFFVNAAGGKEEPVVIGKSKKPRCFKHLKDKTKPYKCRYFSNSKAWMRTEIMVNVLTKLNGRLKREGRRIILFLDKAPCHPHELKGQFSNITLTFLPKNTTSKTQPLDAGIIKLWKVKTRRKLLRFVCSKVGQEIASEIVKSVHLLQAIQWGKQAWDEIDSETIQKCFAKVGMYPEKLSDDDDDDPFEGEEMMNLNELCSILSNDCSAEQYLDADDYVPFCDNLINIEDSNWREELRRELLNETSTSGKYAKLDNLDNNEDTDGEKEDDDFDVPLKEPDIKTTAKAVNVAENLLDFAYFTGNEELCQAVINVNDILTDIRLAGQKQAHITDFFKPS